MSLCVALLQDNIIAILSTGMPAAFVPVCMWCLVSRICCARRMSARDISAVTVGTERELLWLGMVHAASEQ